MTLYLTDSDVERLVSLQEAISRVELAMREWGKNRSINIPRSRVAIDDRVLNVLPAGTEAEHAFGFKAYVTYTDGTRATSSMVLLYDTATGKLDAIIQAGLLTRIRTGAATAVASKYLARKDSHSLGVIGAGRIGEMQLAALMEVFRFSDVLVYDVDPQQTTRLIDMVRNRYRADCLAADSPREICKKSDIIVTATYSKQPVISGDDLRPGVHVDAVGANSPDRAELDEASLRRARFVVVDSKEQCRLEAGDLIRAAAAKMIAWDSVVELPDVVSDSGRFVRREDDITIFKSVGIAIEDIAVAKLVFQKATKLGVGQEIPVT